MAVLAPGAAPAESLSTDPSSCGGDAYSSAQVIEGRPPRRGPITAVPDTLCADLSAPRSNTRIEIYGLPGQSGEGLGNDVGADGAAAPYDGERRGMRRFGPARRGD
jgi:hypothetical protein